MRAVLICQIPVRRVAVFAEMAWMERRPELGLLCRAARDHGGRISAAAIQAALPGLSDAGADNVRAWCRMIGLCDAQGGLTALGQDVAERDQAPIPEQGVYCLWIAAHPVIGRRVLAAERLSSTSDQRFESIQPLPVEPERDAVFCSVVDPRERFLVRNLPANHGEPGCIEDRTDAICHLRWTLDFDAARDQWQLEGMIEVLQRRGKHAMRPMQHKPESDGLDLWALMALWGAALLSSRGRWQASDRRLAVAFYGLGDQEQDTFQKTLQLGRVEVPGKGSYDDVTLEDVPIGPMSADDAQRWAMSRFDRHLSKDPRYRSWSEVQQEFTDLTEGTPLERFYPALPAADALAERYLDEDKPALFWALTAPIDLAPRKRRNGGDQ